MVNLSRFGTIAVTFIMACAAMAATLEGGRGPGNRNAFPDVAFPQSPAVVWKSYLGEQYVDVTPSNALVVADKVIVAFGRHLIAVSIETGEGRWMTQMPDGPIGDILLLDNQIVVSFAGGNVSAYDPGTGKEVWKQKLNGGIRNNPQYTDSLLFYSTRSRRIEIVARKTGASVGSISTQDAIEASPLILGDFFFLAFADGRLSRIEAKAGIERWKDAIPHTLVSLTPVTNGRLVIVTATNGIYAFNPYERLNGQRWSFPCGNRLAEPVTMDTDRVYVTTKAGRIYCLDLATGKNLWVPPTAGDATKERTIADEGLQLPAAPTAAPEVVGNYLVVRMEAGLLALYQKQSGMLEWLYRLKPPVGGKVPANAVIGRPAVDGDRLFFAGTDGYIYHLAASSPDIDPPGFSEMLPKNNILGYVSAEGLNYVGAVIEDEGSGLRPAKITIKLDAIDLTPNMRFDARSGFFYAMLPKQLQLTLGLHRLELTAQDLRGNTGVISQGFIVAPQTSPGIVPINISGEFQPKDLQVYAGTILLWTNYSGGPRTVISDLTGEDGKPIFSSDAQFPEGIPNGASWVWIVPADMETGTSLFYHCRLNGEPGDGTEFGTGLVGFIEVVDPANENPDAEGAPVEE